MGAQGTDAEVLWERIAVHVDITLVYLRRLANHIVNALAPVWFIHYEQCPKSYRDFAKQVKIAAKVEKWGVVPEIDLDALRGAFTEHSRWFELLAGRRSAEMVGKGVRDALEHEPVAVLPYGVQSPGDLLQVMLSLQPVPEEELAGALSEALEDLCLFCEGLIKGSRWRDSYRMDDAMALLGQREDATAFWPKL